MTDCIVRSIGEISIEKSVKTFLPDDGADCSLSFTMSAKKLDSASALDGKAKDPASAQQQSNITVVPKKDASGRPMPGTCDGTTIRIRLFDDRERVLFFKVIHDISANYLINSEWCIG